MFQIISGNLKVYIPWIKVHPQLNKKLFNMQPNHEALFLVNNSEEFIMRIELRKKLNMLFILSKVTI